MESSDENKIPKNDPPILDILTAVVLFIAVVGSAFWVVGDMSADNITVFTYLLLLL